MMRVAVVHYHLQPGGVTRVIERAAAAVQPHGIHTAVLCGPTPNPGGITPDAVIDGLGYAQGSAESWPDIDPDRCRAAARKALGGEPELWHIHNHALGKNAALPRLVAELARAGVPLLLHIHDFAEDGRPDNYRRLRHALGAGGLARLYPIGPKVRYAVLTRRDRDFLRAAGAPEDACVRLPNPVEAPPGTERQAETGDAPLFLYPTRAIRRKNVGELLLWAALLRGRARFATTLSPANPEARPIYEQWRRLAVALNLPVAFGAGENGTPYSTLLQSAHATITTSVAEGFGLAFLEPWGAGLPLVGRNLPDITADFTTEGIRLDGLYDRLDIPADWVDRRSLNRKIEAGVKAARSAYGLPCPAADVERAQHAAVGPDGIDFARLDEELQSAVIRRAAETEEPYPHWAPPDLLSVAHTQAHSGHVADNAERISHAYSLARYGERLRDIYQALLSAPGTGTRDGLDPESLLRVFSDPARFFLLRAALPEGAVS